MEAKAHARYQRVSTRRTRPVADLIRGKKVEEALAILKFTPNKGAEALYKAVKSAASNAEENHGHTVASRMIVKEVRVDAGPAWKRFTPRAYGRASLIRKPTSHITIVLSD